MDVGGDFYDVLTLSDHQIAVVMGDVSGHGISAALLTAMLTVMTRSIAPMYTSSDKFLHQMNNEIYKIFENGAHEMYVCMFCAVIDTGEKKIYYSNAGEALPVLVRDSETQEVVVLNASGLPLGMLPDSAYEYHFLNYDTEDMLVFHTDGLSDVFYKENPEEFSNRFHDLLTDAISLEDPSEIIEIILNAFYNYKATENEKYEMDDVSLILCKF